VASIKNEAKAKFDRWSGSYERDRRSRFNARLQERALDALALAPPDRFLDVGCGTGAAVRQAAGTVERAVGVDLSEGMIERARELAADTAGAEFVVGDSELLPFGDGSFSAILCTASFHHYADPDGALAEMARVLVAEGRLVLADGTADLRAARVVDWFMRRVDRSHVRLYRTAELLAMLARAGFVEPQVEHLWDGGYAIISVSSGR
jgi:ubiquinone/menaquinone biosynthesis C-methylase UbiE